MRHLPSIFFILMFLFSCQDTQKQTKTELSSTEKNLKRALANGYYSQINDDVGVSFYQNNIYFFSTNDQGFSDDKFLLHLINQDRSFVNSDFFNTGFSINDSLSNMFVGIDVIQRTINYQNYKNIRIGQFKRNTDQSTSNIWVKEILVNDILNLKENYKNQLPTKENLVNEEFFKHLRSGKFFKSSSDFYILLSDGNMFFITDNNNAIKEKVMLHFIREDNTFNNLSFKFEPLQYQQFLEQPFKDLQIVKIHIPEDDFYPKIRIGQYNESGNIWVQEFFVKDIYDNELLKYNDEFEKSKP